MAAPTGNQRSVETLCKPVDEIYRVNNRLGMYYAVAEAYENWSDLIESATQHFLETWNHGQNIELAAKGPV